MAVSRYVTLSKVKHAGVEFPANTPMALSDASAAPLLAAGAIAPQAGALPAMPTVPGDVVRETLDTATGAKAKTYLEVIPGGDGGIGSFSGANGKIDIVTASAAITYDAVGRVATRTDARGTWTLAYDSAGRLLTETATSGTVRTHNYDSAGRWAGVAEV